MRTVEQRLQDVEDRLAIYNLLASHPISADTGSQTVIESIYTDDAVFDRGEGLQGAQGLEALVQLMNSDAHRAAIAGGLAHFASLPMIELDGDSATAISHLALITPDATGDPTELPNHGVSSGFRIHRILVNQWSLRRVGDQWRIAKRLLLPADGTGPALDLLHHAPHYGTPNTTAANQ